MSLRGQWIGPYVGGARGFLVVNVDEYPDHFQGAASVLPSTSEIPSSVGYFTTTNKDVNQKVQVRLNPVHPRTLEEVDWAEINELYPDDVTHSSHATAHLVQQGATLQLTVDSSAGHFTANLTKSVASGESSIAGIPMSWEQFKNYLSNLPKSRFLFRGQKKPWRLCTSFHRKGRFRVREFIENDVRSLHRRLSGITSHYFDLEKSEQNGAFYNLLQHHGYPTPLLDWSYSPYVAAFFAYRGVNRSGVDNSEKVRIYLFDYLEWQTLYKQSDHIDPPLPHLSVMEFISIANPRQVPQQAVTTATNLVDIESYILQLQVTSQKRFLTAIDLPASERETAMEDLRFMGITAGSIFPGIDGVCEELRERNFDL